MLSEECLPQDGGGSLSCDVPESMDVTSKKKKSFHPLRSLKRFFGHGGGSHGVSGHGVSGHGVSGHGGHSRRRSNNDDVAESSSVLLKARSTTDVIVSADSTEEAECAFQRVSKQISLSADSIFSTERTCDSNLPVSAISSEALLHSDNCGANSLLQRKDDDEGLPQSPCNLATTAELFIENGLKEEQSEKWPSFDSGHSLLSVDSNENDAEEDFFKEKWVAISKSPTVNDGNDLSAADSSLHDDLDLNLIQRHPSLISSAVIHRLAVRPKGKRILSSYQQKFIVTSMRLAAAGKPLPFVKEESGAGTKASDADGLGISESREKFSSSVHSLDTAQSSENENPIRISCAKATPEKGDVKHIDEKSGGTKKVKTNRSFENVGITGSSESDEGSKGIQKIDSKKGGESVSFAKSADKIVDMIVVAKSTEVVDQGDSAVLRREDLKRETISTRTEQATENAEESSKPVTDSTESESLLSQMPAKQTTVVPLAAVVVRQKPPRAVAPTAQEIHEMAARRQTLTFTGESGTSAEKPVSKRSSMVIPDRPLVPAEAGNTELAQMFSKFQRRSSQKRQPEAEVSKPVEDDSNSDRANENVSQMAANSKPGSAQTASKEKGSAAKAVTGVRTSGKHVEVSSQVTGGSPAGVTSAGQQIRTGSVKLVEKKAEKSPESGEGRGSERKPGKVTEKSVEKTTEKNIEKATEKNMEKTADMHKEKNVDKTAEKSKEKSAELKIGTVDKKEANEIILNKSENVKNTNAPLSDEKAKGLKKAYSISCRVTKSPAEKSQQGTAAASFKTRSSSQSEPLKDEGGREVPTMSSLSLSTRRGSFTYTRQNDGRLKASPAPGPSSSSEISSRTESEAGTTTSDSGGRATTDVQHKLSSVATPTRPPSRPGMVPSSPGMVAAGSRKVPVVGSGSVPAETVPSGVCAAVSSGTAASRAAVTPDRTAAVPLGSRVVIPRSIGSGAVRPTTGIGGGSPKECVVPATAQVIPTSDKSLKEAKASSSNASEKSGHQASSPTNRDAAQPAAPKSAPSIRSTTGGGQRIPAGKKDGENLVEWVGVARQKTRAWRKDGKIDVADRVESCN